MNDGTATSSSSAHFSALWSDPLVWEPLGNRKKKKDLISKNTHRSGIFQKTKWWFEVLTAEDSQVPLELPSRSQHRLSRSWSPTESISSLENLLIIIWQSMVAVERCSKTQAGFKIGSKLILLPLPFSTGKGSFRFRDGSSLYCWGSKTNGSSFVDFVQGN